jgi:CRISPR/Cas system CSM-associated protein Csm3 (group 7 of RAMP superfamily)
MPNPQSKVHSRRYLIRVMIETTAPLAIGSGRSGLLNQRLIVRDPNHLPYLPGSSLAGVLRHRLAERLNETTLNFLFGYQGTEKATGTQTGQAGQGSRIRISAGILVGSDGETVLEGLNLDPSLIPPLLGDEDLPERDHVRINHRGVVDGRGKFMAELVPTGTRFVFETELLGEQEDEVAFEQLIEVLRDPTFRLGGSTRQGRGSWRILRSAYRTYNLRQSDELDAYLQQSASLQIPLVGAETLSVKSSPLGQAWEATTLTLEPADFFFFGSGDVSPVLSPPDKNGRSYPESWLDMLPKQEKQLFWEPDGDKERVSVKAVYLLPGSSIKGALAHRLAFHYNRLAGHTIENSQPTQADLPQLDLEALVSVVHPPMPIEQMDFDPDDPAWEEREKALTDLSLDDLTDWEDFVQQLDTIAHGREERPLLPVGSNNPAVQALFGYAKDSREEKRAEALDGQVGRVLIPDLCLNPEEVQRKTFDHVAVDRFTGGALAGALFEEEVLTQPEPTLSLTIFVHQDAFAGPEGTRIRQAWQYTLQDLGMGKLTLGGSVNKGHGVFTASTNPLPNENSAP